MKSIRRPMALLAGALLLAFATIGVASAQETPTPTPTAATPTPTATPPSGQLQVHGVITGIDKSATPQTVSITPREGAAVTVKIVTNTRIHKAGIGAATLNDLTVDDRAFAQYDKNTMEASVLKVGAPPAKHHGYHGTIKSIGADKLVLSTKRDTAEVTIDLNTETRYKVPGLKDATLANFKAGDKVAVLAVEIKDSNTALHVQLIPSKPLHIARAGVVEAYEAGKSITIKNSKGETTTFLINSETRIRGKRGAGEIKVGDTATVSARREPASDDFEAKHVLFSTKLELGPERERTPGPRRP